MADSAPVVAPNGAATASASAAASAEAARAQIVAELEKGSADEPAKTASQAEAVEAKAKPAADAAEPVEAADPDDDITDADLADDDDDAEPEATNEDADLDEDDEDAAALAAKEKADPDLAKRLSAVRKQERRAKDALARERQELESEKAEWHRQSKQIAEAQQRFDQLAARAKYDPVAVLTALGVSEDDFEPVAQMIYAHSKAGAADPKRKELAARALRERERDEESKATKRELAELKAKLEEQAKIAAADRQLDQYFAGIGKLASASDKTPLTKTLWEKNPQRARVELEIVAAELAKQAGGLPSPKAVVIAYEKKRRAELRDHGIDPKAVVKAPPATAKADPAKGAKPTAPTAAKAAPAPAKTEPAAEIRDDKSIARARDPLKAEILAGLEAGDFD